MKDPIQKYFQVGTIQWMTRLPANYPILESAKTICCNEYFSVLEITHIEDQDTKDRVRDMLAQGHMKVCYGTQPHPLRPKLNPNDLGGEGKKKAEAVFIDFIDEAEYMGTKGITSPADKWEPETKGQVYAQLLKTTRAVCSYAASKKMMVKLGVFDFDMDEAVPIGLTPYVARSAVDMRMTHSNFGLLVDLSCFPTTYETPRFVIQTLRPYITHPHIGNATIKESCGVYGNQYPRFGFLESASDTMQLVNFSTVLREEGFFNKEEPYVSSLEVKPWVGEDGDIILANTERVISQAWASVEDGAQRVLLESERAYET